MVVAQWFGRPTRAKDYVSIQDVLTNHSRIILDTGPRMVSMRRGANMSRHSLTNRLKAEATHHMVILASRKLLARELM